MNGENRIVSAAVFETPVCRVLVSASAEMLCEVFVCPDDEKISRYLKYMKNKTAVIDDAGRFFETYSKGRDSRLLRCDFDGYTLKEKKVLETLGKIRFGETISYGELALRSGFPGAARFTGSVMRKNRFPLILPCHRVILSDGSIGEYSGGGPSIKAKLLYFESSASG